jgi:hypothetical protein
MKIAIIKNYKEWKYNYIKIYLQYDIILIKNFAINYYYVQKGNFKISKELNYFISEDGLIGEKDVFDILLSYEVSIYED